MKQDDIHLAVIGLGYVGLPLAATFGKKRQVLGFDVSAERVRELQHWVDVTQELTSDDLKAAQFLRFSSNKNELKLCNVFIIAVPTPLDEYNRPDLKPLLEATEMVASVLKPKDLVIYEPTLYPGAIEDECVPILEKISNLQYNTDFFVGYSPERSSPGNTARRLENVCKITSGSTPEAANRVDWLYREIIKVGTHQAPSIRVAEAAKVFESIQSDVNIALINELAILCNQMGLDTQAVLQAAATKWNFVYFRPGLAGGNYLTAAPYYLAHKAQQVGYQPDMMLAGRRLNTRMGNYVAQQCIEAMTRKSIPITQARILIMGLTFKENCTDIRNTRVVDIVKELQDFQCVVDVFDPLANKEEAYQTYGISLVSEPDRYVYDAIIITVAHRDFNVMGVDRIHSFGKKTHVLYDLRYLLPEYEVDLRL